MTHAEEYENFVGSEELDPAELCRHCHDYPCCCTVDDLMLHDDWDAEIDAQRIRNSESKTADSNVCGECGGSGQITNDGPYSRCGDCEGTGMIQTADSPVPEHS